MRTTARSHRTSLLVAAALLAATATLPARLAAQKAAAKLDDPTIVAIFDAANSWDIETGTLAAKHGATKEVRDFGAMLAHDHGQVRQQGRDLARKLGVTPTPPKNFAMATEHAATMKQLKGAHGTAFDRAFLQHEVDFHKAVIDAMNQTLVPALHNAEVKGLVTQVAPAFTAHQLAAQRLLDHLR